MKIGKKDWVMRDMHTFGLLLWCTGCVRLFKDGDSFSYLMRWWHPVTYVMLVVMLVPCALMGEKLMEVVPLRLKKYWRERRSEMVWVTPFTSRSGWARPHIRLKPVAAAPAVELGDWD